MAKIKDETLDEKEWIDKELEAWFKSPLTPEEEKELRDDKLQEEADSRDADLEAGWVPGE